MVAREDLTHSLMVRMKRSYGVEETDPIDVHEVTADGDIFVIIKDGFGGNFYLRGLHMMYLAPYCLAFYVLYARPIDVLSHSDILLQD